MGDNNKEILLTEEGYKKMEAELEKLKTETRAEIAERIKVALGFGDLSENSEYDEAKTAQAANEDKIAELEAKLRFAKIIDDSEIDTKNPVAKYENEPTNIFSKFVKYVLEIGKESYIKRVIALPGEHVEIKEGKVYINGKELDEPYLQDGVVTDIEGPGFSDFIVPENTVFAMGDNRTHSTDCRAFGCIPLEKIESTVAIRIWPLDKWGHVD